MQSTNKDTATGKSVALVTGKKVKKFIAGLLKTGITVTIDPPTASQAPTLPGKAYDDSVSTDLCDGVIATETLTDAEGHAIQALRDWNRAARDPEYMRFMDGWYVMRTAIDLKREGRFTIEEARQTVGNSAAHEYYDCIVTADYILHRLSQETFGEDTVTNDGETFADFDAWQLLHHETKGLLRGDEPLDIDVADQPELHAATKAIRAWIIAHRAEAQAKKEEAAK